MGVDVSRLSPKAQEQVFQKLLRAQQYAAGSAFGGKKGKHLCEGESGRKASKYGNKKVEVNGIIFDSKREARRWLELDALAKAGEIQNLRRQVPYLLIPSQRIDGKVVEREVKYVADFVYEQNGETVVEDSKGHRTKDYILKRKMLLYFHGIRISEV